MGALCTAYNFFFYSESSMIQYTLFSPFNNLTHFHPLNVSLSRTDLVSSIYCKFIIKGNFFAIKRLKICKCIDLPFKVSCFSIVQCVEFKFYMIPITIKLIRKLNCQTKLQYFFFSFGFKSLTTLILQSGSCSWIYLIYF